MYIRTRKPRWNLNKSLRKRQTSTNHSFLPLHVTAGQEILRIISERGSKINIKYPANSRSRSLPLPCIPKRNFIYHVKKKHCKKTHDDFRNWRFSAWGVETNSFYKDFGYTLWFWGFLGFKNIPHLVGKIPWKIPEAPFIAGPPWLSQGFARRSDDPPSLVGFSPHNYGCELGRKGRRRTEQAADPQQIPLEQTVGWAMDWSKSKWIRRRTDPIDLCSYAYHTKTIPPPDMLAVGPESLICLSKSFQLVVDIFVKHTNIPFFDATDSAWF